jgi:ABC-type Zn uptake system ZnuABC Zn-binding protein ZnuA
MRGGNRSHFLVLLLAASGCGSGSHAANSKPLVVAAFYPIAYAAERVDPAPKSTI